MKSIVVASVCMTSALAFHVPMMPHSHAVRPMTPTAMRSFVLSATGDDNPAEQAQNAAGNLWDKAKDAASDIQKNVEGAVSSTTDSASDAKDNAASSLKQGANQAKGQAKEATQSGSNIFDQARDAAGNFFNQGKKAAGGATGSSVKAQGTPGNTEGPHYEDGVVKATPGGEPVYVDKLDAWKEGWAQRRMPKGEGETGPDGRA